MDQNVRKIGQNIPSRLNYQPPARDGEKYGLTKEQKKQEEKEKEDEMEADNEKVEKQELDGLKKKR